MANRRAALLSVETDRYAQAIFDDKTSKADKGELFNGFFLPFYMLWVSMIYVVHEGLVDLDVEDRQLEHLRNKTDIDLLRRFRNGTFHFQCEFYSRKHDELIQRHGFGAQWELWGRQDFLVRKMLSYVPHNPRSGGLMLRPSPSLR